MQPARCIVFSRISETKNTFQKTDADRVECKQSKCLIGIRSPTGAEDMATDSVFLPNKRSSLRRLVDEVNGS